MAEYQFSYQEFESSDELEEGYRNLLNAARDFTNNSYSPYSHFKVAASVFMASGEVVSGVNIENASYPVGICAERSALSAALSQFPGQTILAIAITYVPESGDSGKPAFPCGMCRQFIAEAEGMNQQPIELILSGMTGKVLLFASASDLLPFSFSRSDLNPKP